MMTANNNSIHAILSNAGGRCIELLHNSYDPCLWTIRQSRKFLWLRLNSTTHLFYDKRNALEFARKQAEMHRSGKPTVSR